MLRWKKFLKFWYKISFFRFWFGRLHTKKIVYCCYIMLMNRKVHV